MPRRAGGRGGSGHKHHVRKETISHYKERLEARGLSRAPQMTPWNTALAARKNSK